MSAAGLHLPMNGPCEVPGGASYSAPVTAAHVLEQHVGLHDRLARPNVALVSLASQYGDWVDEHGHEWSSPLARELFYPFREFGRPAKGWETRFLGSLARALFTATTYQVTAPMCEIAEAMYEQTASEAGHVQASDIPSECGFLWLDRPFRRVGPDGHVLQCRAITWAPQAVQRDGEPAPGVRVTFWSQWDIDPAGADPFGNPGEYRRTLELVGPLFLAMTVVVPFGERFGRFTEDPREPVPLHYALAAWLLLGTEVAVTARGEGISRPARKRALRSIRQNEVQVVTLRRATHRADDDGHPLREVDWTCRWLVRGFYRHRWGYGSVGRLHEGQNDGNDHCLACGAHHLGTALRERPRRQATQGQQQGLPSEPLAPSQPGRPAQSPLAG